MKDSVGVINVPIEVGPKAWKECFTIMADRTSRFGINEALSKPQKVLYSAIAKARGYSAAGLWNSPNPIFWDKKLYKKVFQSTVKLHGRGPNHKNFPGFNEARYANVVVLKDRKNGKEETHINLHFAAYNNDKVPTDWVAEQQKRSLRIIEDLVKQALTKGDVWLYGDFNIKGILRFDHITGGRYEGIKVEGVDKMYRFVKGEHGVKEDYKLNNVLAPTDHKYGHVAHPA